MAFAQAEASPAGAHWRLLVTFTNGPRQKQKSLRSAFIESQNTHAGVHAFAYASKYQYIITDICMFTNTHSLYVCAGVCVRVRPYLHPHARAHTQTHIRTRAHTHAEEERAIHYASRHTIIWTNCD